MAELVYAADCYTDRMPKPRKWTEAQLRLAVQQSTSLRAVLLRLGLKPAGGNYVFIATWIARLGLVTTHFKGKAWNKGLTYRSGYQSTLCTLLVKGSRAQSYKLKRRLFEAGLKIPECELCGWGEVSCDGRVPVELDHMNGDKTDNRLANLRVLCPNCHSLQPTHRGKNIGRFARVV